MDHHQYSSIDSTCNNWSEWSSEENKAFENALAINFGEINQFEKIAEAVPGRTVEEIKNHIAFLCSDIYAIESGLVPLPEYGEPEMCADHATKDHLKKKESEVKIDESGNNEGSSGSNGNKKRGKSWSAEEHMLFIEGLNKYGKGDWRSIAKHCVVSRTAAQVASHAQKFFTRYGFRVAKKRWSIYDVGIMDYVDPKTQTNNDLQDTEQIMNNVGGYGGTGVVHEYPILESFDNFPIVYQNDTTSIPKRPRTKRRNGDPRRRFGLTSGMAGGAINQNTNHHHGISASSSQGRQAEEIVATRCKKTLPVQEEGPVLAPVGSTIEAPNSSGSSVQLTHNLGASSFDFYSHDLMDVRDFELFFSGNI